MTPGNSLSPVWDEDQASAAYPTAPPEVGLCYKGRNPLRFLPHQNALYSCSYAYFLKFIYFYLFLGVLGLRFCARAFSSCGKRGPLFIAVHGPLTIAASLVAEHRLQTHRLSNCGSRAQLLHSMWDLPRPGLEPMSPALAGRFSTTAPPGKPLCLFFNLQNGWDIWENHGIND